MLGGVIAPVIAGLVRGLCFVPGRRCHVVSPQKVSRKKVHGPARAWHASVSIRNPRRNQKPLPAGDLVLRLPHKMWSRLRDSAGFPPASPNHPGINPPIKLTANTIPLSWCAECRARMGGDVPWRGWSVRGCFFRWECCWTSRSSPPPSCSASGRGDRG